MKAGSRNVYTCQECGGKTVTVDRDEGVTPFMIGCRVNGQEPDRERCTGMMHSAFYRDPSAYLTEPEWEWFSPTPEELTAYVENIDPRAVVGTIEHVEKGGLLIRRAPTREADDGS